ncbi:hypothetical protein [Gordonia soli]|uniref:Uncharacterized protein n=1 Tax=Gordonia soli NBRC 108243 TaxID=1223545 RepID=M0QIQ9_9ACTN|nr:hypothetical protein [Gordonia soli]GAC67317.1 hypothetical protein GS4_07_00660 [Gordonia soli NBRC 108243]
MTTPTTGAESRTPSRHPADSHAPDADNDPSGFPLLQAALFVAGCALLVLAAANLTHLTEWSQRWGQIPVFLGFFLLMSIAGRWFWTGTDAILAKTIGNQ